ncbi:MAG: hypothetical protein ACOY4L_08975 [Pseudomonadota bacterium]
MAAGAGATTSRRCPTMCGGRSNFMMRYAAFINLVSAGALLFLRPVDALSVFTMTWAVVWLMLSLK